MKNNRKGKTAIFTHLFFQLSPDLMAPPTVLAGIPYIEGMKVNLALAVTIIYVVCYLLMDPLVGGEFIIAQWKKIPL